ncbi:hypothetical protein O6072_13245 [Mycolicibacterium neoaurum]|uniref:hypothetical protein n=1 Tax=Mycolicibacterium neoaurum TaxID=1795 RepID=UPI00248B9B9D|nr:hypothetical protein [Mycolicibacterium neoaurum]WBP96978.1 hypothetical protein O7W24_12825 [Mycolicibacterium neoaurum]WBS10742.1 hypothetical protein O6072_13245 [Mycolicibacterium neoaurum]
MIHHRPRYGLIDLDYAARLSGVTPESEKPCWMVNLMKYRAVADYGDGVAGTISGREADDLYAPLDTLAEIGAELCLLADVETQLLGDAPTWDRIAVVRYPTGRSFIDMQSRPDFQAAHVHKEAGMDQTIVLGCDPLPYPPIPHGLEQLDWKDVPEPPSTQDGPVMIVHVLRFADPESARTTPDAMQAYQSAAAGVALSHGARVAGWFRVDGTIVGDGRSWHQVRFNLFPSRRAFMAVATDPARLQAQKTHRDAAIADTYTMITRPVVNTLAESLHA